MNKILWFSNCAFTDDKMQTTGTWLIAMGEALLETNEVELSNITYGNVKEITRRDCKGIKQWIIPIEKPNKKGLASLKTISFIKKIETEIYPDLIHIWGTEGYWGMLAARKILFSPILLDMQGILYAYAKVFYGGLSNKELLRCIGLKEIVLPKRLMYFKKQNFIKRGKNEHYIIQKLPNISVQSEWVKAHVKLENPTCQIFDTGIILRSEFCEATPWDINNVEKPVIFTSSSGAISYKGLHILLRAVAVLKKKFPNVKLKVAGSIKNSKYVITQDGYTKWLLNEAKQLGLQNSIEWLGSLNANEIISHFYKSSVVVVPSYIETYCLALAEAMIVGVPTVVSYAGAMPELAQHNESALFFPVGDYMSCSIQIEKILENKKLANHISQEARKVGIIRNNKESVVKKQLEIYKEILKL